ncbi:MAG: MBL fold metallo-hydrolase [Francisellaceae bacterium]|jgi:sulfur dioxygenase|nr:MBL fold metallo-hydrolase [Francisellaceae bacterium]
MNPNLIFEQLFEPESCTYTYLISSKRGGDGILIDPVRSQCQAYLSLLEKHNLNLSVVIDTHVHADHVTGAGALQDSTSCKIVMGEKSKAEVLSYSLKDLEYLRINDFELQALYTPGHTSDSYCFLMGDRIFTGDTLLIGGTGRTDFQSGSPSLQYDSLFNNILKLPEHIKVYPAHDYNKKKFSTIGDEIKFNPRLQVKSKLEYVELMNSLELPPPKLIDVAIPANLKLGRN